MKRVGRRGEERERRDLKKKGNETKGKSERGKNDPMIHRGL